MKVKQKDRVSVTYSQMAGIDVIITCSGQLHSCAVDYKHNTKTKIINLEQFQ